MPDLFQLVEKFASETRDQFATANADGKVTFGEGLQILFSSCRRLVAFAENLAITGPEKKAAVMQAVDTLYDRFIAPIDLPGIPNLVVEPMVDSALKLFVHQSADAIVEMFVRELPPPAVNA